MSQSLGGNSLTDWFSASQPTDGLLPSLRMAPQLTPSPHGLMPATYGPVGTETAQGLSIPREPIDPLVGTFNGVPILASTQLRLHGAAEEGIALAEGLFGPTFGWHGTPHTFAPEPAAPMGAFRDAAIGSGEGSQAYGWGHYVAGKQRIAEHYRNQLTGDLAPVVTLDGTRLESNSGMNPGALVDSFVKQAHFEGSNDLLSTAEMRLGDKVSNLEDFPDSSESRHYLPNYKDALNFLQTNRDKFVVQAPPKGNLYHVEISPEEHELLDWDKPLGTQPADIQAKLAGMPRMNLSGAAPLARTGEELYGYLREQFGQEGASVALHEAGVPGIKYLDASSRGMPAMMDRIEDELRAEQSTMEAMTSRTSRGLPPSPAHYINDQQIRIDALKGTLDRMKENTTRNYVIFHPSNLRVIGRNGEKLGMTPVEHNPFEEEQRQ